MRPSIPSIAMMCPVYCPDYGALSYLIEFRWVFLVMWNAGISSTIPIDIRMKTGFVPPSPSVPNDSGTNSD